MYRLVPYPPLIKGIKPHRDPTLATAIWKIQIVSMADGLTTLRIAPVSVGSRELPMSALHVIYLDAMSLVLDCRRQLSDNSLSEFDAPVTRRDSRKYSNDQSTVR